ncbi:MAG: DUF4382 domain-containing protein [bacterium]
MKGRRLAIPCVLLFLLAALSGCSSGGDGTASAYVKDAVSNDFREVHLVITQVSIHQSAGGNETAGWKVLFSGSVDVNLMNASGTKAAFLGQADVPAGKYQQMRIMASSAYGITTSGARVTIGLPNNDLKVVKGFKVDSGKETQLVLDLDLEKSLKQKGADWEFKPVIGKLYAAIKDKSDKPAAGKIGDVDLKDDAAE